MKLHELQPAFGAKKAPKRVGRGIGSGMGKTATRGHKGQWARSGGGVPAGFEGGQMPIHRRLPKRGFTNAPFKKTYSLVNLTTLQAISDDHKDITPEILISCGVVRKMRDGIKVLGNGELTAKINVTAHAFSASAKAAIEAAGGTVQEL